MDLGCFLPSTKLYKKNKHSIFKRQTYRDKKLKNILLTVIIPWEDRYSVNSIMQYAFCLIYCSIPTQEIDRVFHYAILGTNLSICPNQLVICKTLHFEAYPFVCIPHKVTKSCRCCRRPWKGLSTSEYGGHEPQEKISVSLNHQWLSCIFKQLFAVEL